MRLLRSVATISIISTLVGCQTLQTVTSVISGNAACSRSERFQEFPEQGTEAEIHLKLDLVGSDGPTQFTAVATCEYQGSMCGGGSWFQVWYGNQAEHHSVSLPYDSTLRIRPHGFCIFIDEFRKACEVGSCDPKEHFVLQLQLGDAWTGEVPELSGRWGSTTTRRFSVGIHEISQFGFEVGDFEMRLYGYLQELAETSD